MAISSQKSITTPKGFRAAAGTCGIKRSGKPDLALIVADKPCTGAGVFTTNTVPSPSVITAKQHLRSGTAQAIVCSSGNANASTGRKGTENTLRICQQVARQAMIHSDDPGLVLPSSTGTIGRQLPITKISRGIAVLASELSRGPVVDAAVARAIMTTDLVPKQAYRSLRLGAGSGKQVHLAGVCKGSGMIAPNMATMLAFITTDANISRQMLASVLRDAVSVSFNRISVDQHTSPSDSVQILASGGAGNPRIAKRGRDFDRFKDALLDLCHDLAYQIVCDGEGATKVFCVQVLRAKNEKDADRIASAVVNSPLVKTAVHGGDPNWGRIVTAAGYSGAALVPEKMSLRVGPCSKGRPTGGTKLTGHVCVLRRGQPVELDAAAQRRLKQVMAKKEVAFTLDLGLGKGETRWLGCDLSKAYVTINADYTT